MRTSTILPSALVAALVAIAPPARAARDAAETDALFEKANQAYLHGDFQGAIDAYEKVLADGVEHEDLHYNLGNAYVKADRLGPAILHYEQALALDPSQEDARANLALVREAAAQQWQDKLLGAEADPWWKRALERVPPGSLALAFLGVYALTFLLAFGAYLLRPGFARVAMIALLLFAVAGTLAAGGLLAGRWYLAARVEQGIVLPDELAVKEGPAASTQTSFLVHAGLRVRVIERDQEWVRVRLANGLEGWTRQRDIGGL